MAVEFPAAFLYADGFLRDHARLFFNLLSFSLVSFGSALGCSATLGLNELDAEPAGGEAAGAAGSSASGNGGAGQGGNSGGSSAGRAGAAGSFAGGGGLGGNGGKAGTSGAGGLGPAGSAGSAGTGAGGQASGGGGQAGAGGGSGGGGAGQAGATFGGAAGAGQAGAGQAGAGQAGAGQAGAGQAGSAGTGGSPPLGCPVEATVLHTLPAATSFYRDVQTNGSVIAFLTSEVAQKFFLRTATLATEEPSAIDGPFSHAIDALRFAGTGMSMVFVDGNTVHFSKDQSGIGRCLEGGPGWSLMLPPCNAAGRRFAFNGSLVAMSGCGNVQSVGPVADACGVGPYVASKGTGVGATDETLGLALGTKVFTVDRVGGAYSVREKGFPTSGEPGPFASDLELGTIDGGEPAGAATQGPWVYTSVRDSSSGKWDLRRYKIGMTNDAPTILYAGIDGLSAFAILDDGRLVWARKGGVAGAGATLWRGTPGGEASEGPATLVGCAPIAPTSLAATSSYLFFADPTPPVGAPPSLRGVALPL